MKNVNLKPCPFCGKKPENSSTDNLIKRIEENFEDLKKACVNTYGDCEECAALMSVFRDYTDVIVSIIKEEKAALIAEKVLEEKSC